MRFCPRRHISVSESTRVSGEPHLGHARCTSNTLAISGGTELDYLAVHPDNQGRGIATQLVASGLKEAKRIGLDVYVRAFRPGVGLYRRLGFRLEKEFVLDDSEEGGPGEVYRALMTYALAS
jgi:ribosomal protein S18 acetylase RimI-like enzyme